MKSSMIWIILICIVVAISIIILFSKNEKPSSKDILGDKRYYEYYKRFYDRPDVP